MEPKQQNGLLMNRSSERQFGLPLRDRFTPSRALVLKSFSQPGEVHEFRETADGRPLGPGSSVLPRSSWRPSWRRTQRARPNRLEPLSVRAIQLNGG